MASTTRAPEPGAAAPIRAPSETFTATIAIPRDACVFMAPLPETLTQDNVRAVTGIAPRAFLRLLRDPSFPLPVVKLGKLRIVDRAAFVAWLLARAERPDARTPDPVPREGVDSVLAEVGYRRVGGGKG